MGQAAPVQPGSPGGLFSVYNIRMASLSALDDLNAYRRLFTDASFWAPYVREACGRHGFGPCEYIRSGLPGTCPTFIVSDHTSTDRWVVKFFGRLFNGAESFAAEQEAARLIARNPEIPTARVLAAGALGADNRAGHAPGWHWPYLIFEFIPGSSLGQVMDWISFDDRLRAARQLGQAIRGLHEIPLKGSPVFSDSPAAYLRFIKNQRVEVVERHRAWGSLPPHLIRQIERFLPPIEQLVDLSHPAHLIHADLTRDHLLGEVIQDQWQSRALIDFGDAMSGSLLYELAALHLDLFVCNRRLLAAFLEAYQLPKSERAGLPRKALATALLHRFNLFEQVPAYFLRAKSLDDLASQLWDVSEFSDQPAAKRLELYFYQGGEFEQVRINLMVEGAQQTLIASRDAPPFNRLIHFLLAIALGDFPRECLIEEEGRFKTLRSQPWDADPALFRFRLIANEQPFDTLLIDQLFDRRQFVSAFYNDLILFLETHFDPQRWGAEDLVAPDLLAQLSRIIEQWQMAGWQAG